MVWMLNATRHNGHYDMRSVTVRDDSSRVREELDDAVQDARRKTRRMTQAMLRLDAVARQLYDAGASDGAIAKAARCGVTGVRRWRLRDGLESNFVGRAARGRPGTAPVGTEAHRRKR